MVKFGFKTYEINHPDWSKHHKVLGSHVKRVYEDGEIILPKDEELKRLVEENQEILKEKPVTLYERKTGEQRKAIDYFLPIKNLEYQESDLDYYSVGASNTEQTTHVRFTFLLDYDKFILDYTFSGEGPGAMNLYSSIVGYDFTEEAIEDLLEQDRPIEDIGIARSDDADYRIILVTENGEAIDGHVSKNELLEGLIGLEIYKFEQKIKA